MNTITMYDRKNKKATSYGADTIQVIVTGTACDIISESDCTGNDIPFYQIMTRFHFKDGSTATFDSDWTMILL